MKNRCYCSSTMLLENLQYYILPYNIIPLCFVPNNYCYRGKCQVLRQQSHYDKCHALTKNFNQNVARKTHRKISFEKISVQ
jgi:hypothetical protein